MSQENVEIVRRIYAVLDLSVPGSVSTVSVPTEPFGTLIDSQIEWNAPREFPDPDLAEPQYGYEGAKHYRRTIAKVMDDYRMVPERFIDAGDDRVLVFSREGGRGKGSGADIETHLTAHLWTLKDGKAVRMQSYRERADALHAVGAPCSTHSGGGKILRVDVYLFSDRDSVSELVTSIAEDELVADGATAGR